MRRRRGELLGLVVVVAALAVVAGISLQGGSSAASTTAPSARPAANAFVRSYVAYLARADRRRRAPVREPPGARPGHCRRPGTGGVPKPAEPAQVHLHRSARRAARQRRHDRRRGVAHAPGGGGAHVHERPLAGLLARPARLPDRVLAPATAPEGRAAGGGRGRARLRRRLLELPHGRRRRRPRRGLSSIRRQIATRQDPLAGTAANHAPRHLLQLSMLPQGTLSVVDAVTAAAGQRLSFSFILQQAGGRWQASQFPVSAQ